jgi:hypothetical protein
MSEHSTDASPMGRALSWILSGLLRVAAFAFLAAYFYALYAIVRVIR